MIDCWCRYWRINIWSLIISFEHILLAIAPLLDHQLWMQWSFWRMGFSEELDLVMFLYGMISGYRQGVFGQSSWLCKYSGFRDTHLLVKYVFVNGQWNFNLLATNIPHDVKQQMISVVTNNELEDCVIWHPSPNGVYSARSAHGWLSSKWSYEQFFHLNSQNP